MNLAAFSTRDQADKMNILSNFFAELQEKVATFSKKTLDDNINHLHQRNHEIQLDFKLLTETLSTIKTHQLEEDSQIKTTVDNLFQIIEDSINTLHIFINTLSDTECLNGSYVKMTF